MAERFTLVDSKGDHQTVWNEFLSLRQTLPTEKRVYVEWHRGRKEYAAWTIDLESAPVRSRFTAAREHLAEFLLEPYRRQAHVTLFVCGFLTAVERFDDDYPLESLDRHLEEVRESEIAPFEIEIGGINSFATAPYLEVFDVEGGIERIRNVLSNTHSEIREGVYVPHLTLGLYTDEFDIRLVAERISSFGPAPPIPQFVDRINLSTYSAWEIAGPLTVRRSVDLTGRASSCSTRR